MSKNLNLNNSLKSMYSVIDKLESLYDGWINADTINTINIDEWLTSDNEHIIGVKEIKSSMKKKSELALKHLETYANLIHSCTDILDTALYNLEEANALYGGPK